MSGSSNPDFQPLGKLDLNSMHKSFKKTISDEDRKKKVQVIWDFNTCPLGDEYDHAGKLIHNLTTALKHLDSNLEVETPIFAAGDTGILGKHAWIMEDEHEQFKVIHCENRSFTCLNCKGVESSTKTSPEVLTILHENLIGRASDYGSPYIILMISADFEFAEALTFLRLNKFVTILACAENSHPQFRDRVHYTYLWSQMKVGGKPTYKCETFPDDDKKYVDLKMIED